MRTSLTFLTLLAAASSAVAAPLPAHEAGSGAVQKIVSSHRRSDSRVVVDMQEHLTDKSNKSHMNNEYKSSKNAMKSETNRVKEAVNRIENRRSRSTKRANVALFPEQDPGPKAGMVDASMKNADAHIIQTPGKDRTIVDANAGGMDAKVNLPKDTPAPVKEATKPQSQGQADKETETLFGGNGASLSSKKGPMDGVVNDGKGGPQGVEVSMGDNRAQNSPSASPSPSAAAKAASSPKPTSSAGPQSSASASKSQAQSQSKSKAAASGKPSASASAARAPPRSSSSAAPKSSAAPAAQNKSNQNQSCPPCQQSSPAGPQAAPAQSSSSSSLVHMENDMKLDIAKPNVLTSKKPIVSTGNAKDNSQPAKIEFGKLPKNTVPCDGIMVRDSGDVVDMCVEAHLLEDRPKNYHACPEYTQHEFHSHYEDKHDDEPSRQIQDYVRLCMGAGAL